MEKNLKDHNTIKILIIVVQYILAILFIIAGSGKFDFDSTMAQNFINWKLGTAIMVFVGVFEVAGGLLLMFKKTIKYAVPLLIIIMFGAAIIHFLNFKELGFPLLNVVLILLLLAVLKLR